MNASRTCKGMLGLAVLFGALVATVPARAVLLFSDSFSADSATSVLNFNSFINWNVVNHPTETVDYIRSGGFGINCVGNAGGCVDLDGTSNPPNAGRMQSKQTFTIVPSVVYTMTIDLSGNQRGGSPDAVNFGLEGLATFPVVGILSTAPFTTRTLNFVSPVGGTTRLFVEDANATGDFLGAILDNVVFSDNQISQAVDEPATLVLLGLALVGLAALRRKPAYRLG